jgi:hypothetical protein
MPGAASLLPQGSLPTQHHKINPHKVDTMRLIRFWQSCTSRPGKMVDTHGIETYHAADRGMSGNCLALPYILSRRS